MPFGVWTPVGSQPSAGRGTFRDTTLGHAPRACDRHAGRYSDAASRYRYWATCYSPFFAFTTTTHTFNGLLYRWAGTRKVKPIWILLEQEAVTGSGISWAICKSAPRFRQITTPAPHHSVFYRPYALPATQPTQWLSKHWRHVILPLYEQDSLESCRPRTLQSTNWANLPNSLGPKMYFCRCDATLTEFWNLPFSVVNTSALFLRICAISEFFLQLLV